jgi:hypothetical protein
VVWSGTRSSRPSSRSMLAAKPPAWRKARWTASRRMDANSIAASECQLCPCRTINAAFIEPERQVPKPPQASRVGWLVLDPIAGLRDAMPAGSSTLEGMPQRNGLAVARHWPRFHAPTPRRTAENSSTLLYLLSHLGVGEQGEQPGAAKDVADQCG